MFDRVEVDVAFLGEPNDDVTAAKAPGKQVGMVLHLGHEHLAAVLPSLLRRDAVECIGRALHEDHDLLVLVDAKESGDDFPGVLICLGGEARLVAGAPVHARVDLGERVDRVPDAL
jgi:hypothetical protein